MKKINLNRSLLALSAVSLSLMPLVGAVQARPKDDAPAYGYRDNDRNGNRGQGRGRGRDNDRGKGRDNDRGRDRYDDGDDDREERDRNRPREENFGRIVTLEGVVTQNNTGNKFRVRAGGQTFDVRSDSNISLREGDRVLLRGSFESGNNFNATSVRVIGRSTIGTNPRDDGGTSTRNYRNGQRVSFSATFVQAMANNQSEVRSEDGRTFRVENRFRPREFRNGDRVQVRGAYRDSRIVDATITLISADSRGSETNNGFERPVDFPGRIQSVETRTKTAIVRGDNGRTYRVLGSELNGFRVGERVRVRGVFRNGTIHLSDLDRIG